MQVMLFGCSCVGEDAACMGELGRFMRVHCMCVPGLGMRRPHGIVCGACVCELIIF